MHPRAYLRLRPAALLALLRIFILCELLGQWPVLIGVVHIVLLPKATGGLRPIGLFPFIIRLWMRMRLPLAQAWQAENATPHFYAEAGKGADAVS